MRVIVNREVYSDTVRVHVLQDFPPQALTPSGWELYREGEMPPAYLEMNTSVAEVVASALTEIVPALPATEDALQDARTVRDRLLTLIERWES